MKMFYKHTYKQFEKDAESQDEVLTEGGVKVV